MERTWSFHGEEWSIDEVRIRQEPSTNEWRVIAGAGRGPLPKPLDQFYRFMRYLTSNEVYPTVSHVLLTPLAALSYRTYRVVRPEYISVCGDYIRIEECFYRRKIVLLVVRQGQARALGAPFVAVDRQGRMLRPR